MTVKWTTADFMEGVLVALVFLWGILLLFPGNTFTTSPRSDIGFIYALDWFWGSIVVIVTIPMFFNRWRKHRTYRKIAHGFYWLFWLAIFCLLLFRSIIATAHFNPAVLLIGLPFLALALLHAIIYAGLGRSL